MTIEHLEQISGYTMRPQLPRTDRSGIRRSARLLAQAIRSSRRHARHATPAGAPHSSGPTPRD
jgi:hypothetical protein